MIEVPGYRSDRALSASGSFQLLRATRAEDGAHVTLKVAEPTRPPSLTNRLRHEFELTHALRLDGVLHPLSLEESRPGMSVMVLEGFGETTLAQRLVSGRMEARAGCRLAVAIARAVG